MKKILIASACAFTLCFTSCASKTAPEAETQTEAPELTSEDTTETDNSESQEAEDTTEEETSAEETLTAENFPEPEVIEEPEIITLEPVDEAESSSDETEPASEEVENEEPPVIADTESEQTSEEADANSENTENADNTENTDVIIDADSDDDGITAVNGGIDITDDDEDSDEENSESEKTITPSRSVTLKKFEYLDVTYPGTGWIYMGLTDNSKDIAYFGRKLGTKDTKFTLQARAAGTKIIHFYRNDPLTQKYLDDYLEVIILAENGSNKTHIEAPEYKLPVQKKDTPVKPADTEDPSEKEEKPAATSTETPAATNTKATDSKPAEQKTPAQTTVKQKPVENKAAESAKQETPAAQPVQPTQTSDPSVLLKDAQVLYNEKEYAAALAKLNQFFEYATDNRDEALYLKGQILEAKSAIRDIKGSIDAYTSLTKNYPASKYWDSANKRIIYLKRFYLEVR